MKTFAILDQLRSVARFHMQRHGVLASNLTNAETPGYKPKDILFQEQLDGAVDAKSPNYEVVETDPGSAPRLDFAMAQITANRVRHDATVELGRRHAALLRYASTDGGQ